MAKTLCLLNVPPRPSRAPGVPRPLGQAPRRAEPECFLEEEGRVSGEKLFIVKPQDHFPADPLGVAIFREALRVMVLDERLPQALEGAEPGEPYEHLKVFEGRQLLVEVAGRVEPLPPDEGRLDAEVTHLVEPGGGADQPARE